MTVELQYAETHLRELIAAVDCGEQVTIARRDGKSLQLIPGHDESSARQINPEQADLQLTGADHADSASGRGEHAMPFAQSGDEAVQMFWRGLRLNKGHRQLGMLAGTVVMPSDEEWRAMDEEIERDFEESRIFPDEAEDV